MIATNICSSFGGFRCRPPLATSDIYTTPKGKALSSYLQKAGKYKLPQSFYFGQLKVEYLFPMFLRCGKACQPVDNTWKHARTVLIIQLIIINASSISYSQ